MTEIRRIVAKEVEKGALKREEICENPKFLRWIAENTGKKFLLALHRDFLHFFPLTRREPASGKGMAGGPTPSAEKVGEKYPAKTVGSVIELAVPRFDTASLAGLWFQ